MCYANLAVIETPSLGRRGGGAPMRRKLDLLGVMRRRPRDAGRRLGPALAILAALVVTAWAGHLLSELNRALEDRRAAATAALLQQYGEAPVADARARLSRVWEAHRPQLDALLARVGAAEGDDRDRALLEWDYVVSRIIAEEHLAGDIEVVLGFYRRAAACVADGACDPEATAAFFGHEPWRFRDQYDPYLRAAFPAVDVDGELARIAPPNETG